MVELNKTITLKLIFLISIIALSSAFFIEYVLGHQPCNLCILERIPYLFSIIIIVLNYQFIHLEKYFIFSLILIFLAATILSLYHLGIEQGRSEEHTSELQSLFTISYAVFCLKKMTFPVGQHDGIVRRS